MRLILLHEGIWNFLEFVFRIKVEPELVGEDASCSAVAWFVSATAAGAVVVCVEDEEVLLLAEEAVVLVPSSWLSPVA